MTQTTMLPLARYRLHWRTLTPTQLPDYAGSMLRGAFGHALRRIACMTKQKECTGCPLIETCAYSAIFAPPPRQNSLQRVMQTPASYLIEPPPWGQRRLNSGDEWHFNVVLCGRALTERTLITLAFRQALERGIGIQDGRSQLLAIDHESVTGYQRIYQPEHGTFAPHATHLPPLSTTQPVQQIRLHLKTPLRLQENGRALPPNRLTAQVLLMAAVRRAALMQEFYGQTAPNWNFPALKAAAALISDEKNLTWKDWTRRSNRQQQTMQLGGVIGTWTLSGELQDFLPALHLCQWLHLGKETVFGMGHYQLEHISTPPTKNPKSPLQQNDSKRENKAAQ